MARIRSIKPEFFTDPEVVACTPLARLLFIGSWNLADDYGVLKDDPERLRLQLLPGDDVDACALVDELVKRDLLRRMVATDGTNVLVIRTFCVHQKIDRRAVGRYGIPDDFQPSPTDPAESPPIPTVPNHTNGTERNGTEKTSTPTSSSEPSNALVLVEPTVSATPTDPVVVVFDAWRESTGHQRAKLDPKRRKLIRSALGLYPVDDLVDAVRGWRHSPHHRGENQQRTVYNDLGLVLRDAAKIEMFRDLERNDAASRPPPRLSPALRSGLSYMERHHEVGA